MILFLRALLLTTVLVSSTGLAAPRSISSAADLEQEIWGEADPRIFHVLLFHSVQCPISDRYVPTIKRLDQAFGRVDRLKIHLVFPNANESDAAVEDYLATRNLELPVVRDGIGLLAGRVGAQVTPEAVVLQPGASGPVVVYRGRYDDRYTELGKSRPRATVNFLENVLSALVAGERVEFEDTKAVGCYIVPARGSTRPSDPATTSAANHDGHGH